MMEKLLVFVNKMIYSKNPSDHQLAIWVASCGNGSANLQVKLL